MPLQRAPVATPSVPLRGRAWSAMHDRQSSASPNRCIDLDSSEIRCSEYYTELVSRPHRRKHNERAERGPAQLGNQVDDSMERVRRKFPRVDIEVPLRIRRTFGDGTFQWFGCRINVWSTVVPHPMPTRVVVGGQRPVFDDTPDMMNAVFP